MSGLKDGDERPNSTSSILAIDVGNTRTKLGLFEFSADRPPQSVSIQACRSEPASLVQAVADWATRQSQPLPTEAAVAGSDPETRDQLLEHWPLPGCTPLLIDRYQQIPIQVDVDFPERVGIDRLLNTWAAWTLHHRKAPVIAVDSGTATTVDLITQDGTFRGGSILPGLRLSAHAMHDYTARLPLLNTDEDCPDLPPLPGRNTEEAMRAGLVLGQLGAVRELCSRLSTAAAVRFHQPCDPMVYVSGGGGRQLVKHLPGAVFVDSLALHGLAMLAVPQILRSRHS